ncbi:retropepsin-like aspartic protease family protein [Thiohalobacter thiocyanaticus]|uniref:Aspartyl protease n=1 Tax=Thiohalobacter thiocyanaticus TaxID=585455 RepID=A0A426QIC0_9GAMM|nr:retropepsin-like aspartic protease [Thiohalobacter thiocyanaticus]RRQ21499.1 hypothetical protein D6C00_05795 [Thiohalobacter thiocyanaticus]
MKKIFWNRFGAGLAALWLWQPAVGQNFDVKVPMQARNAATFYVSAEIDGFGKSDFLVDTGSGYMTINEDTLAILQDADQVEYIKDLSGILANGDRLQVPVYRINRLAIGGQCEIRNVEAAVFPGSSRQILGLSALTRAAPFVFSTDPAELLLTCGVEELAAADTVVQ